ncbi:MAG: FlgK family flagellar hook-associated protein, partial [Bdellovibrionales bacterium]
MTSLLNAVRLSFRGLEHTQAQIGVASQNITNADREGYSRKTFRADYITGNFGTAPVGGQLLSALNPFLLEGVVNDTTDVGRKNVIAEFLDVYVRRTGNVVSDFSLTSTLNDFFTNLDLLAATPENRAQKEQIVSDAEVIALYLRDMSSSIQDQRTEIELEIDKSVDRINESLTVIHDLNDKILRTSGKNSTTLVEYEDQRATEVQKLAEEIDITFYVDGQNRIQIYHPSGQPLLLSEVRPVEFDPIGP